VKREALIFWAGSGILLLSLLGMALRGIEDPGLYYDEAFLAQQARDFVEPAHAAEHPASVRTGSLFGRPFPLRNAVYLGSLKSQLLIPSLALFGSSVFVLRMSTLVVGGLGLVFSMLFARRLFGTATALVSGVLVSFDPGFFFLSQFEWGPFTTGLLCRGFGLYALLRGFSDRSTIWAVAGGLACGLGVYSRADFVVILVACGLGLVICNGHLLLQTWREQRSRVLAAGASLGLAASPMLLGLYGLFVTSAGIAGRGDLGDKGALLWSVLAGKRFAALAEVGGRFEDVGEVDPLGSLFGYLLIAALLVASIWVLRDRSVLRSGGGWILVATAATIALTWVLPGAVRLHHVLNLLPFAQILCAWVLCASWQRARRLPRPAAALLRVALAASLLTTLLLAGRSIVATQQLLARSGGRGHFSKALDSFAAEHALDDSLTFVSLDWGFHEPLSFLTSGPTSLEPIWEIPRAAQGGSAWRLEGDEHFIYLVHDRLYDRFGLGPNFLGAARAHGSNRTQVEEHLDGEGQVAFLSVRFREPHRILFDGGFRVRFAEPEILRERAPAPRRP